jgi:hypothetical protein
VTYAPTVRYTQRVATVLRATDEATTGTYSGVGLVAVAGKLGVSPQPLEDLIGADGLGAALMTAMYELDRGDRAIFARSPVNQAPIRSGHVAASCVRAAPASRTNRQGGSQGFITSMFHWAPELKLPSMYQNPAAQSLTVASR